MIPMLTLLVALSTNPSPQAAPQPTLLGEKVIVPILFFHEDDEQCCDKYFALKGADGENEAQLAFAITISGFNGILKISAPRSNIHVVIDNRKAMPTAELNKDVSGPIVIRISEGDYRDAKPCLPPPSQSI